MEHRVSESDNPESAQQQDGGQTGSDHDTELAATRDRLAFYESFDSLIQENVRRSGELLRQVAAEREAVETRLRQVNAAREEVERRLAAMRAEFDERQDEQRRVLGDLATTLGEMEAHLGAISSRVHQSLASLSNQVSSMPAGTDLPEAPAPQPGEGSAGTTETAADSPTADGTFRNEAVTRQGHEEFQPGTATEAPAESPSAETGTLVDVQAPAAVGTLNGLVADPVEAPAVTGPRTIDVVIHGVAKAATALSIQRYLQNLPGVSTVEVREYVSGVLRIQVVATTLSTEDLRRWEGGGNLQTVSAQQHVLELKLPGADGF